MSYHEKKEEKSHPLLKPAISVRIMRYIGMSCLFLKDFILTSKSVYKAYEAYKEYKAHLGELFNNLPLDLLRYIAEYMNFSGVKNFLLTNESTYKSFFENRFWQRLWRRDFYYEFKDDFKEGDDPEKIYKERYFYWRHRGLDYQRQKFKFKVCALPGCEKSCDTRCSTCKQAFYCSEDHHKKDWKFHRGICRQIKFFDDLKCPLSGDYFIQPYGNGRPERQWCGHIFERKNIIKYIGNNVGEPGFAKCPYPECKKYVRKNTLRSDGYGLSKMIALLSSLDDRRLSLVYERYFNLTDNYPIVNCLSIAGSYYKRYKLAEFRFLYLHSTGNKELWFTDKYRLASVKRCVDIFCKKYFSDTENSNCVVYYRGKKVDLNSKISELGITHYAILLLSFTDIDLVALCAKYRKENMDLAKDLPEVKSKTSILCQKFASSLVDIFGHKCGKCAAVVGKSTCGKKPKIQCSECNAVYYCSGEHGDQEWNNHKGVCNLLKFTRKLKCSLTGRIFMEPVKTEKCEHIFEKAAILKYFENKNTKKCPYKNCGKDINKNELKRDFFVERMIATFCYLLARKKSGWQENLEESNIINPYSRFGLFFGKQEQKIRITVKHLSKSAKNFEEKELSCSLVSTVKRLVHYFYELNKQEIDPDDPPVAVYDGEEIDLTKSVGQIGIHYKSSLILFLKSDNEFAELYEKNKGLSQQWRQKFQGN